MQVDRRELRRLLLFGAAALVLCFVALVYRSVDHAAFIWDDHTLVESAVPYKNASFGDIMLRSFWPENPLADARVPYYRPLVLLSFQFDLSLGGRPAEFHLTNLLLHILACALLGLVAVRAGAGWPRGILAMLGWGVLPRLTEDVAWISGRTDVLAGVFGFAALCLWPEVETRERPRPWFRSILAGFFLLCALGSKEVAVAVAIAMGACVVWRGGTRATLIRAATCLGVPIIAWLCLRTIALAGTEAAEARSLGPGRRIGTIFEAIGRYAEMVLDPVHPRTSIGMLGEVDVPRAIAGGFVLVGSTFLLVRYRRRLNDGAKLGLLLGLTAILPVLHVIPFTLAGSVTSDRLLYVPLAGIAIALACSLHARWVAGVVVVFALVCGHATRLRAETYNEETEFWVIAGERGDPHNTLARMSLASHLLRHGEVEPACRLYEKSAAILAVSERAGLSAHRRARESLAGCHARLGRYEEALRETAELAKQYPESSRIALALGFAEVHVRDFDRAADAFAHAARLDPGYVRRYGLPPGRLDIIRNDEAHYAELPLYDRAVHLTALGRGPEASAQWDQIVRDGTLELPLRHEAVSRLVQEGPFVEAEAALIACPRPRLGWDTNLLHVFRLRRVVHRALEELQPRVDALAR